MTAATASRRTQEERREATRDALVSAAVALLAERGVEATTMQDVAERAGVSKGALTHHYESKEALIDAVLERVASHLERAVSAAWDPTAPPFPRLKRAIAAMVTAGEERSPELRVLVALAAQGGHDARLGAIVQRRLEAVERVFVEGFTLTLAELHAQPRVAPEALCRALVASLLGSALRPGVSAGDPRDVRRLWEVAIVAAIDPFVIEAP